MKLLVKACVLALAPTALASGTNMNEFNALFGPAHDAGAVMSKLTGMMGEAKMKLSLAEKHHKKVVKKVRKEAEDLLNAESTEYGQYFNGFSHELAAATDALQAAVDEAKVGIAKSESKPASPNDWKDPEVEIRAKLSAQVASADRTIKRDNRRHARALREAEEHAEETLEEEAQKLGMKIGDMTPLVDQAKKTLEAVADKAAPAVAKKAAVADDKAVKADLQGLGAVLKKATDNNIAATKEATKKLDGFLTKTDKDVATKTQKIQADLESRQKEEIAKVLGKTEVVATKKVEVKKVETKKVEAKKVDAKRVEAKKVEAKKVDVKKVEAAPAKKVEAKADVKKVEAAPAKKVEAAKAVPVKAAVKK